MKTHARIALATTLALTLGCAATRGTEPAAPHEPVAPAARSVPAHTAALVPEDSIPVPLEVTWRVVTPPSAGAPGTGGLAGGPASNGVPPGIAAGANPQIVLAARVEYRGRVPLPITLDIRVPAGATVVQGVTHDTLPPATAGTIHETVITLSYATVPAGDVVAVADARSPAFGLHSEIPYRFGRPAPALPRPVASGAPLIIGGRNLGPAIQVASP